MGKTWEKSAPELVARFDTCLPKTPDVERRQMFGCPCAFVNGNMFTGMHEQRIIVRLAEGERPKLLAEAGASDFTVMGKTMREYVAINNALERAPSNVTKWMKAALIYAASLPAKQKKVSAKTVVAATRARKTPR
jgi:TfoX/Sxy family transcriptional regulator of competence genes